MKPPRFDYLLPRSLDEALGLLAEHGEQAKVLAGGQSLVPLLNFRLVRPGYLVDLNDIPGLDGIRLENGRLAIGAMTRQRAAETSPLVRERCPLLADALPQVGHVQIRNRGTVGGSLCHGLLHDWPLEKTLRYANAAGAIVASRLECSTAMPTAAEVAALAEQTASEAVNV